VIDVQAWKGYEWQGVGSRRTSEGGAHRVGDVGGVLGGLGEDEGDRGAAVAPRCHLRVIMGLSQGPGARPRRPGWWTPPRPRPAPPPMDLEERREGGERGGEEKGRGERGRGEIGRRRGRRGGRARGRGGGEGMR